MDRTAKVGAALGLIVALAAVASAEEPLPSTFAKRHYAIKLPKRLDAAHPAPLVLALHCYGCDADSFRRWFQLDAAADERGFILVAPDGKLDARDRRFWNATEACCDFDARGVDDVAFLAHLIAEVRARHPVDPKRIYVLGFSNGGFMAHRLACELSTVVAGVVSIGGGGPRACAAKEPVALLEIHSDTDEVVPFRGGSLVGLGGLPAMPPVSETIAEWAHRNGCAALASEELGRVSIERHGGCAAPVELWILHGAKHIPPRDAGAPAGLAHAFDFLLSHPKP